MTMKLDSYFLPPGRWPPNATLYFDAAGIVDRYAMCWAADGWKWQWIVEVGASGEMKLSNGHWQWHKRI